MSSSTSKTVDPTVVLLIWSVVGFGLGRLWPVPFVPGTLQRPLLGVSLVPGMALWIWAMVEFRRHGTSLDHGRPTTALVTTGPFRFSRNPVYVGMTLMMIGFSIEYESLWALLLIGPAMIAIRRTTIASEESLLEERFGQSYLDYRASVPRWIGPLADRSCPPTTQE